MTKARNRLARTGRAAARLGALFAGLLLASPAPAAPRGGDSGRLEGAPPTPSREATRVRPRNPHPIIDVVGEPYKPKIFIFLGRKALDLDWSLDDPRYKRSFLERTLESVWSRPF